MPFRGQTTQNLSGSSPNRDCTPERVKCFPPILGSLSVEQPRHSKIVWQNQRTVVLLYPSMRPAVYRQKHQNCWMTRSVDCTRSNQRSIKRSTLIINSRRDRVGTGGDRTICSSLVLLQNLQAEPKVVPGSRYSRHVELYGGQCARGIRCTLLAANLLVRRKHRNPYGVFIL